MKRLFALGIAAAALALPAAPAFAISPPAVGQPNVDCQSTGPAGLFTTQFTTIAAGVYANDSGSPASMHSTNTAAESQYDVACFASAH
jgi:hypothetical protein